MQIGDTVWLKSGGPEMIIECQLSAYLVFCSWRGMGERRFVFGAVYFIDTLTSHNPNKGSYFP